MPYDLLFVGVYLEMDDLENFKKHISAQDAQNHRHIDGSTLLMEASYHGSIQVTRWLIAHGANIYAEDEKQETALHFAIAGFHSNPQKQHKQFAIIKALLDHEYKIILERKIHSQELKKGFLSERGSNDTLSPRQMLETILPIAITENIRREVTQLMERNKHLIINN